MYSRFKIIMKPCMCGAIQKKKVSLLFFFNTLYQKITNLIERPCKQLWSKNTLQKQTEVSKTILFEILKRLFGRAYYADNK